MKQRLDIGIIIFETDLEYIGTNIAKLKLEYVDILLQ